MAGSWGCSPRGRGRTCSRVLLALNRVQIVRIVRESGSLFRGPRPRPEYQASTSATTWSTSRSPGSVNVRPVNGSYHSPEPLPGDDLAPLGVYRDRSVRLLQQHLVAGVDAVTVLVAPVPELISVVAWRRADERAQPLHERVEVEIRGGLGCGWCGGWSGACRRGSGGGRGRRGCDAGCGSGRGGRRWGGRGRTGGCYCWPPPRWRWESGKGWWWPWRWSRSEWRSESGRAQVYWVGVLPVAVTVAAGVGDSGAPSLSPVQLISATARVALATSAPSRSAVPPRRRRQAPLGPATPFRSPAAPAAPRTRAGRGGARRGPGRSSAPSASCRSRAAGLPVPPEARSCWPASGDSAR